MPLVLIFETFEAFCLPTIDLLPNLTPILSYESGRTDKVLAWTFLLRFANIANGFWFSSISDQRSISSSGTRLCRHFRQYYCWRWCLDTSIRHYFPLWHFLWNGYKWKQRNGTLPPSNFSNNAELSSNQHCFVDLTYGIDRTIDPNNSTTNDRDILFQALIKLYFFFKRSSGLRLLRDFISNLNAGFVNLYTRNARIAKLLELLDRRSWPRDWRGGSRSETKSTQGEQTLSESRRLAIQKKGSSLSKNFCKSSCNIAESGGLWFVQISAKETTFQ